VWIGAPGGNADLHLWRTSFLSHLASQGTWARLTSSFHSQGRAGLDETIVDRWRSLSLGFNAGPVSRVRQATGQTSSLWQQLANAGKKMIAKSYPPEWPFDLIPQSATRVGELDTPASAEAVGWDVLLSIHETADSPTSLNIGTPEAETVAKRWASWDRCLSAETVGMEPSLLSMVVALPTQHGGEGLLVLAGSKIAAVGDLGTLDSLDIAPTVLSFFDLAIPSWMEGLAVDVLEHDDDPLSDAEQELLQQHLAGLGYFG